MPWPSPLIGNPKIVVALLDLGADPHALSNARETPLDLTVHRDRPEKEEIVETLRAAMKRPRRR